MKLTQQDSTFIGKFRYTVLVSLVPLLVINIINATPATAAQTRLINSIAMGKNIAVGKVAFANTIRFNNHQQLSDFPVKGVVKDDKGMPIPGVTVKVRGSNVATFTNANGEFSVTAATTNDVLVFTSVGFESQEVQIGGKSTIPVTLKESSNNLNQVVVVGFGTQKAATVTGSVSTVTTKDLVQSPVANISNSLVGRLPGLFASQASGEPGADQSTLRIRGISTFSTIPGSTATTDPLIIVDGIEVPNYNNIDPNEIESLSILKDASTTAVYGVRGANGVLLITTKRGKLGTPQFSYTFNEAINSFTALRKPMDAFTYGSSLNQALANDAYANGTVYTPRYSATDLQKYKDGSDPIFYPNINWYDVMLRKYSAQQTHNFNVSGGTETIKYFFSAGYFNQQGLFKDTKEIVSDYNSNTNYRRYNFRSNFDFQVNKRLKITVDLSSQNEQRSGNNAVTSTVIDFISKANPVDATLPIDGKIVNVQSNAVNPLQSLLSAGYRNMYSNYLNGIVRLNHKLDFITPGLNLRTSATYQNFNSINYLNALPNSSFIVYTAKRAADGTVSYLPSGDPAPYGFNNLQAKNRKEVLEFGFDYDRKFGDHNVTGLLLYRQQKLYDPTLAFLVPNGYQSFIGRADYNYKGRYLAQFTASYEGTENFAPGKRFGFFPAYSVGWVVSEEPFFSRSSIINFLKFRASYGTAGNDKIGGARFLYNPTSYTYGVPTAFTQPGGGYYLGDVGSTYQLYTGVVAGNVGNPNLTWERAVDINLVPISTC